MLMFIAENYERLSKKAAQVIRDELLKNIDRKRRPVLGLATGSTPLRTHGELIKIDKEEEENNLPNP